MKRTGIALGGITSLLPSLAGLLGDSEEERKPVTVQVLPSPDAEGLIVARAGDGRRFRVPDMAELASAVAAQSVPPRLDLDHQSEPLSRNYHGSTRALGWGSNPRVSEDGGLEVDIELTERGRYAAGAGDYRFVSPGMRIMEAGRDMIITGLSSIALVNNPAFDGLQLANEAGDDPDDRAARRDAEEMRAAAEEALVQAAEVVLDGAIESGRLPAASRDYHLAAVRSHRDGPTAGLKALRSLVEAAEPTDLAAALTSRRAPRGAPPSRTAPPAADLPLPPGYQMAAADETQLDAVRKHAKKHGVSFRDAVMELGAIDG